MRRSKGTLLAEAPTFARELQGKETSRAVALRKEAAVDNGGPCKRVSTIPDRRRRTIYPTTASTTFQHLKRAADSHMYVVANLGDPSVSENCYPGRK